MKKLIINLLFTYLIFSAGPLAMDIYRGKHLGKGTAKVEETVDIWKRPEYQIIIPKSSSEVLMKRDGLYVFSGKKLSLADYGVREKKEVFISLLVPAIDVVAKEVAWKRDIVVALKNKENWDEKDREFLAKLYAQYNVKDENIDRLIARLIMPPKSLIISQAALESGWGTSRFFREGNNIFGVWSYNKNEPRIPALVTRENGFTAHLKSYADLKGSVEDYVLLLSKNVNYAGLREGIRRGETSTQLAGYLGMYSELRDEYIVRVRSVIKANKLEELD